MTIKKIALQLTGNLRTFEQCAPYLKKYLLSRYDCDVFLHTFGLDHQSPAWHGGVGAPTNATITRAEMAEKIIQLYNPVQFFIDNKEDEITTEGSFKIINMATTPPSWRSVPLNGIYRMMRIWQLVSRMRQQYAQQQEIDYDLVVHTRPDIQLLEPLDLAPYQPFFDFNPKAIVFFPLQLGVYQHATMAMTHHHCSDVLFAAKPIAMNIFCDITDQFDRYFKQAPNLPLDVFSISAPETFQNFFAIAQGLQPLFGRINYLVKRFDSQKDMSTNYKDRLEQL